MAQTAQTAPSPGGLAVGAPAPDVTLPTVDGGALRLRDLRGRRVLLFCWASW